MLVLQCGMSCTGFWYALGGMDLSICLMTLQ
jgi:hypothetical protein